LLEVRRTFLVAGMERVFAAPQEESFTTIWGSRSNHPSYGWLRVWCVGGVGGSDALILMSVILNRISWNCAFPGFRFPDERLLSWAWGRPNPRVCVHHQNLLSTLDAMYQRLTSLPALLRWTKPNTFRCRTLTTTPTNATPSEAKSTPWKRVAAADPESSTAKRVSLKAGTGSQFLAAYENELAEISAGALGKSQRALDNAYLALHRYREKNEDNTNNPTAMHEHNELRNIALQKRNELLIHRQCCGFRLNNDALVIQKYPIPKEWTMEQHQPKTIKKTVAQLKETTTRSSTRSKNSQPPSNYICNICMTPGHWREHCTFGSPSNDV
jgi:hypothetical protein